MATKILMQHPDTKLVAKAYTGFSWTAFFFGPFVAAARGDWKGFLLWLSLMIVFMAASAIADAPPAAGIGFCAAMGFTYNKLHALSLIKRGYRFAGTDLENKLAAQAIGATP